MKIEVKKMYRYSLSQWILFFFWYCFLGWIWECFYVSMVNLWKKKKWKLVNRGFLHGPIIPIYGFAAVTILLATIRMRDDTVAVYVLGALTATLFELVTGTVMEQLFKVKYWDYSNLPLNYHGHICLFISLFWGFFAVLLVQIVHLPVECVLVQIPPIVSEAMAFVLIAAGAYDTSVSVNEAMDLREIVETLTENNETLQRLERRFDAVVAFTSVPDIENLREMRMNARESISYRVERLRDRNDDRMKRIKERLQLPEFEGISDRLEILERLEQHKRRLLARSDKQFMRAARQLKRNPTVNSKRYGEALETLRELLKNRE